MDVEQVPRSLQVVRPAVRHRAGGDGVLEQEIPADDPRDQLAERGVRVGVRAAGDPGCDIASFVSINVLDSHKKCLGASEKIKKKPIVLENDVFVGSHSFIGGGTHIAHHCVVGAGTIIINKGYIPPYSLIVGNPAEIKKGYYCQNNDKNSS